MDLLPKTLGTRPRLAVEIRPEGVVAARSEDAQANLWAVAYAEWRAGAIVAGLKAGNVIARAEAVAAVRKVLEAVALKERQTTLVLPDSAVRVLLLDFDTLPAKATEALPVVRFRLKKLVPFDADDAIVSYQIMTQTRTQVRVLAVAVPRDVLAEYESLVREAGFEPGAVLPSTLAACAGLPESEDAVLLVNAGETGVTTAIVEGSVVLLHRTVDLAAHALEETLEAVAMESAEPPAAASFTIPAELLAHPSESATALPLVSVDDSAGEWAMQAPVKGYGVVDDYDLAQANGSTQDSATVAAEQLGRQIQAEAIAQAAAERAQQQATAERETAAAHHIASALPQPSHADLMTAAAREVTQAVSVAAAYYEDTLAAMPGIVLSAGTLGAETLGQLLRQAGLTDNEVDVREMVEPAMLAAGAVSSRIPHGWLAGVRGALRS